MPLPEIETGEGVSPFWVRRPAFGQPENCNNRFFEKAKPLFRIKVKHGARAAAVPARRRLPERVPTLARIPLSGDEDGTVCVS